MLLYDWRFLNPKSFKAIYQLLDNKNPIAEWPSFHSIWVDDFKCCFLISLFIDRSLMKYVQFVFIRNDVRLQNSEQLNQMKTSGNKSLSMVTKLEGAKQIWKSKKNRVGSTFGWFVQIVDFALDSNSLKILYFHSFISDLKIIHIALE